MKDNINILMYKDINGYLKNENIKYLIVENNDIYQIRELPIIINDYNSCVKKYFAYDYDELSEINKELYKNNYKPLSRIENDKFKLDTKQYKIKKK